MYLHALPARIVALNTFWPCKQAGQNQPLSLNSSRCKFNNLFIPCCLHGKLCTSSRWHIVDEVEAGISCCSVMQSRVLGCNIQQAWCKQIRFQAAGRDVVAPISVGTGVISSSTSLKEPLVLLCCHGAWQRRRFCSQVNAAGPLQCTLSTEALRKLDAIECAAQLARPPKQPGTEGPQRVMSRLSEKVRRKTDQVSCRLGGSHTRQRHGVLVYSSCMA